MKDHAGVRVEGISEYAGDLLRRVYDQYYELSIDLQVGLKDSLDKFESSVRSHSSVPVEDVR